MYILYDSDDGELMKFSEKKEVEDYLSTRLKSGFGDISHISVYHCYREYTIVINDVTLYHPDD